MKIQVLGTGSSGNCYKIEIGTATLLLECGIPYKVIQRKLNFKVSDIDACLLSHEHMDHAKAIKDLIKAGVDCYMTKGTAEALGVSGHRLNTFYKSPDRRWQYNFKILRDLIILPFEAVHDVEEPVSFYIKSKKNDESLVFVTDTAYLKYKIPDCDCLMIECNYVKEKLDKSARFGNINLALRNRIVKNHLSLENLVEALKESDLKTCKKIYLMHLSDGNSDEGLIKKTVQETTGIEVVVC